MPDEVHPDMLARLAALHGPAHEVLFKVIGPERYARDLQRRSGRHYVERCRRMCEWASVDPAAPPLERREALLAKLREALSLPSDADSLAIDAAIRGGGAEAELYDDALQLAVNPNPIRADDAGRVFPIWDEGDLEIGAAPDDQESANPLGGDTLEAEAGAGQPDAPLSLLDRCRAGERPLDEIQSLTRQDRELLFASLGYIIKTEPALGDPCFEPERSRWKRDF